MVIEDWLRVVAASVVPVVVISACGEDERQDARTPRTPRETNSDQQPETYAELESRFVASLDDDEEGRA